MMMENNMNDKLIDMIQDNARYEDFLVSLNMYLDGKCIAISTCPVVSNDAMDDVLSGILEKARGWRETLKADES